MGAFTESVVEEAALEWLEALGYHILHGPEIAAGEPGAERSDPRFRDVILARRLRDALQRLNPDLPPEAMADAYRKAATASFARRSARSAACTGAWSCCSSRR
jgi:type I restriction enzyme, R subunit